jgi:anaerobic selenocysteine-containing dehydrogenase
MTLHYTMRERSDRLLYPEMRWGRSHPMARVTWETAMTRAAAVFSSLIDRYGPDSVGFYVSGQCLTEEYYLANKLILSLCVSLITLVGLYSDAALLPLTNFADFDVLATVLTDLTGRHATKHKASETVKNLQ